MNTIKLTLAEQALADANAAVRARDLATAVLAFAKAAQLGASAKLTTKGHALALSDLGRQNEAVEVFKPWFYKNQKDFETVNLYGVLLKRAGRFAKALEVLEVARKLRPQNVSPWQNIGNVHVLMGNYDKAAEAFRCGVRIEPTSVELWRLHANSLDALGRTEEAVQSLRKALALGPRDFAIIDALVRALIKLGRASEATELLGKLRGAAPDDPELLVIEARVAFRTGDAPRARATLLGLLAKNPGHFNANCLLALVCGDGDLKTANEALARAVATNPRSSDALNSLIDKLIRSRYGSEADHIEEAYTQSKLFMNRFPSRILDSARTLRTVLMRVLDEQRMAQTGSLDALLPIWQGSGNHSTVHYELGMVSSLEDRLKLVEWHRNWGSRASINIRPVAPVAAPALATGRKLRIGFMSSDLRNHPVTYFALPLLESYDREKVEVFCYSFYEKETSKAQDHIASQVTGFRLWPKRPDAQVAEGIAADRLDMLFELGGSSAMNKLEVMAYRPARIGASWLGYPHSAGLEQIDYILTDPFIKPDDPRLLIEKPFEMPETWVAISRMFGEPVIAEGTPQDRKGRLTFGTANNPYKYTPACLDAWAAVLRAVPGSRFVFIRPEAAVRSFIENSRAAFAKRNVDPDRLEYIGVRGDHMRHYNEIDIALDSLPHVGGTTTCEAMWMGVPTVSLVGPGFPERLSYSNLSNAGLGDLAVFSVADYVAKAAELAADPVRRRILRAGLRDQIRANPLGQPERFVKNFYDLAAKVAAE